jgi:hypothetical protein
VLHDLTSAPAGQIAAECLREAIELVKSKTDGRGGRSVESHHPECMPVEIDDRRGRPSRWITPRALRVLNWYSAA